MLKSILKSYGQTIIENAQAIIGYDVLITDKDGIIIAVKDRNRLGKLHSHSLSVVKKATPEAIHKEEASSYGVLEGICLPIKIDEEIIGTVGITGNPAEVSKYGYLVQKLAELFVREKSLRESSFLRESAISNLVAQVIDKNNQKCNKSYILSQAKSLNYDLDRPKIAIIVDILHFEKIIDDIQSLISEYKNSEIKIQLLKASVLRYLRDSFEKTDLITNYTSDKFLILMDTNKMSEIELVNYINYKYDLFKSKITDLNISALFGVGAKANDINDLYDSIESAWKALRIGKRMRPDETIYNIKDFMLEETLISLDAEQAMKYINNTIGKLYNSPHWTPDMDLTLKECLSNPLETSKIAEKLSIHKNSLYYRIDKIYKMFGFDLNKFEDVFRLKIALILEEIFNEIAVKNK